MSVSVTVQTSRRLSVPVLDCLSMKPLAVCLESACVALRAVDLSRGGLMRNGLDVRVTTDAIKRTVDRAPKGFLVDVKTDDFAVDFLRELRIVVTGRAVAVGQRLILGVCLLRVRTRRARPREKVRCPQRRPG